MNAHVLSLPGERPRSSGQPAGLATLGSLPLEAFRLVESDELSWAHVDYLFVFALLHKSADRRLKAGHAGLMVEAARMIVNGFASAVARMYLDRGIVVDLSDSERDRLARELASDMAQSQSLKRETVEMLAIHRQIIIESDEWCELSSELSQFGEIERPLATLNRWLDYVEYLKGIALYEPVVRLHRLLVCCLRVHDAVFDR